MPKRTARDLLARRSETINRHGGLPSHSHIASYDFFSQLIQLNDVEAKNILQNKRLRCATDRWSLHKNVWLNSVHEYRHWLDMTTTTFGLEWLSQLADFWVLSKRVGNLEESFELRESAVRIERKLKGIHLPSYYSTISTTEAAPPWKYASTVGAAFTAEHILSNQHPIWFLQFSKLDGSHIARQPMSIASMLEARAVEAEMFGMKILLESKVVDDMFKVIEEKSFSADLLSRLYTPELTVYSVAAHWHANNLLKTDAADAYSISSKLARFCLGAPSKWVQSIHPSSQFILAFKDIGLNKMKLSLEKGDRAAFFFMLAMDTHFGDPSTFDQDLQKLLLEEWGVDIKTIEQDAREECNQYILSIKQFSENDVFGAFVQAIEANFKQASPITSSIKDYALQIPAVVLADGELLDIFTSGLGDDALRREQIFNPLEYVDELFLIEQLVNDLGKYSSLGEHCFAEV